MDLSLLNLAHSSQDTHIERHLEEFILTPGNKREGAYGCCLDLIASQNTSEIAKFSHPIANCELLHSPRGPAWFACHVALVSQSVSHSPPLDERWGVGRLLPRRKKTHSSAKRRGARSEQSLCSCPSVRLGGAWTEPRGWRGKTKRQREN